MQFNRIIIQMKEIFLDFIIYFNCIIELISYILLLPSFCYNYYSLNSKYFICNWVSSESELWSQNGNLYKYYKIISKMLDYNGSKIMKIMWLLVSNKKIFSCLYDKMAIGLLIILLQDKLKLIWTSNSDVFCHHF